MVAVVADEERSRVKQSEAERMQHKIAPFFVDVKPRLMIFDQFHL